MDSHRAYAAAPLFAQWSKAARSRLARKPPTALVKNDELAVAYDESAGNCDRLLP
jgi:hypothetical protein